MKFLDDWKSSFQVTRQNVNFFFKRPRNPALSATSEDFLVIAPLFPKKRCNDCTLIVVDVVDFSPHIRDTNFKSRSPLGIQ